MKWYPQSVNQKKSEKLRSLITGRSWWKWLSAPQIWRVTMWILWFVWHEIAPWPHPRAHKAVVLCSAPPSQRAAMAFKSTHLFPSVVGTNRSLSAQSQRGTRLQEGGRWWPMGDQKANSPWPRCFPQCQLSFLPSLLGFGPRCSSISGLRAQGVRLLVQPALIFRDNLLGIWKMVNLVF